MLCAGGWKHVNAEQQASPAHEGVPGPGDNSAATACRPVASPCNTTHGGNDLAVFPRLSPPCLTPKDGAGAQAIVQPDGKAPHKIADSPAPIVQELSHVSRVSGSPQHLSMQEHRTHVEGEPIAENVGQDTGIVLVPNPASSDTRYCTCHQLPGMSNEEPMCMACSNVCESLPITITKSPLLPQPDLVPQ